MVRLRWLVSRILFASRFRDGATISLGRALPRASSDLPAGTDAPSRDVDLSTLSAYLVLLPVGFALPLVSPRTRCALTAPFHHCRGFRIQGSGKSLVSTLPEP